MCVCVLVHIGSCLKAPHMGWRDEGKGTESVTVTDGFLVSAVG